MPSWTATELITDLPVMDWRLPAPQQSAPWQAYLQTYQLPSAAEGSEHFTGRLAVGGFDIIVQVWQPSQVRGNALIVHGYYDHVGLYRHLIRYCLERGWRVITCDLPGHGLSSGERSAIGSFQQYDDVFRALLTPVQQHFTGPLHVLGQSTGGAVIMNYLLRHGLTAATSPFASAVLMAPLVRPREWHKAFWVHQLLGRWLRQVRRGRSHNSSDPAFLEFLWHQDPLQAGMLSVAWVGAMKEWVRFIERCPASDVPVCILQGDDDRTVAWRYNLRVLARLFPQQRLQMIAGARHHLVNERREIRERLWHCLDNWLPD